MHLIKQEPLLISVKHKTKEQYFIEYSVFLFKYCVVVRKGLAWCELNPSKLNCFEQELVNQWCENE